MHKTDTNHDILSFAMSAGIVAILTPSMRRDISGFIVKEAPISSGTLQAEFEL